MTNDHRFSRQRLAWLILIGSFLTFFLLGVTIPLGIRAYIQNTTRTLDIFVQANQGTVGIEEENGLRRAVLVGEQPQLVSPVASIRTDTTASSLLTVRQPADTNQLARIQVSSNTSLILEEATTPRFTISNQPYQLFIQLETGRVRVDIPLDIERQAVVTLTTPQGLVSMSESGRYVLEVSNNITQVTVEDRGLADVVAQNQAIWLSPGQRVEIASGSPPVGPLDPARNLVSNSDFSRGLDSWASFAWQVELDDQPAGETTVVLESGDPILRFIRQGIGHADVRLTQSINQDVSDYPILRLGAMLRVREQSLGVCGVQGSECPLFIIVNYIDDSGVSRIWQQGFYAYGTVDDNLTPGACISCAVVQRTHERVPLDQFYFFDVDFRQELARQGVLQPRVIESIALVASGHAFATDVSDISLIVE